MLSAHCRGAVFMLDTPREKSVPARGGKARVGRWVYGVWGKRWAPETRRAQRSPSRCIRVIKSRCCCLGMHDRVSIALFSAASCMLAHGSLHVGCFCPLGRLGSRNHRLCAAYEMPRENESPSLKAGNGVQMILRETLRGGMEKKKISSSRTYRVLDP